MNCLLVGVSHGYQYEGNKCVDVAAFRNLLNYLQALHSVDLLAEELSREAIEKTIIKGVTGSVARNVAIELGISHLFCDPTEDQRKQLGIPKRNEILERLGFLHLPCLTPQQGMEVCAEEKKYWGIREQYWLERLEESSAESSIFILGACHAGRFKDLMERNGHRSEILFEHWQP